MFIDGAVDRLAFETYVDKVLVPELRQADVVIMDNLPGHKRSIVRQLIEAAGARLLYLPPYRPDFNPIENAFAKLKALPRKAAERTVEGLWSAIGKLIELVTPQEIRRRLRCIVIGFCSKPRRPSRRCLHSMQIRGPVSVIIDTQKSVEGTS